MTEDEFWATVDQVNAASNGDPQAKEDLLKQKLEALDAPAVEAFDSHLQARMDQAYSWPLWAAAYIAQGGCSDDGFMDFRSGLIFMGRTVFEAALATPDSLATLDDDALESLMHEGLLYVANQVHEGKTGAMPASAATPPTEPSGKPWDEDDGAQLKALCPGLWQRFGW